MIYKYEISEVNTWEALSITVNSTIIVTAVLGSRASFHKLIFFVPITSLFCITITGPHVNQGRLFHEFYFKF